MVLGLDAWAVRLLRLYLMVHIGSKFAVLQAPPDDLCVFNVTLRDFRTILSWELKNRSVSPTHYTLWYTYMSKGENMKVVMDCANTTRPFCDLTDEWESVSEMYILRLVGFQGNTTSVECSGFVFPDMDMSLEPPEFDVAGVVDQMSVTLKFPPAMPKGPGGQGLWLHLSLVLEEKSGDIVKEHILKINENTTGNFTYVIKDLIPNTNYCVSVYFEPTDQAVTNRSPSKCTYLRPVEEPESPEPAKIGGLFTLLSMVAFFISIPVMLKRTGFICLRNKFPKALNIRNLPAWVFPGLPPLEAVAVVEVIAINRKKKVWNYDYDDESDSDNEVVPRPSTVGYTMHGLTGRPLCPATTSSANLEDDGDPDAQEDKSPEPEDESELGVESQPLLAPGPWPWQSELPNGAHGGRGTQPTDPFSSEDSSPHESSGDRVFFNVDLNTVFVRVLDDSAETPSVSYLPEETRDLGGPDQTETSLLEAGGEGTQPSSLGYPVECLCAEGAPSGQRDACRLDLDNRGGYMRR